MTLAKLKALGAGAVVCVVALGGVSKAARPFQDVEMPALQPPAPKEPAAPRVEAGPPEVHRELEKVQAQLRESMDQMILLELQVQALRKRLEAARAETAPAPGDEEMPADPAAANGAGEGGGAGPGESSAPKGPALFRITRSPGEADLLLVISPGGEKVVAYDPDTGRSRPFTLAEGKATARKVTPVVGQALVALAVRGGPVNRLAVLEKDRQPGTTGWYPIALREPVGEASPVVDFRSVVYVLGRRIYAFSSVAERWGVLELPEGPSPVLGDGDTVNCQHEDHIYTFDLPTGAWKDLDLRALLDAPENPGPGEVDD